MNDKYQSGPKSQDDLSQENDPLDELARIVSGEDDYSSDRQSTPKAPKPEDILAAGEDRRPPSETAANADFSESDDLEAELMRELGDPDTSAPTPDHAAAPEVEPETHMDRNETEMQVDESVIPEPSEPPSVSVTSSQDSFDDALMSAIDEELASNPDTRDMQDSGLSYDDSTDFDEDIAAETTHLDDDISLSPDDHELVAERVEPEAEPSQAGSFDELADLEAELSSAFDEDTAKPEPDPLDVAEAELDFEAAFAQELNNNELAPPAGWQEEDAVAANAAFAAAAAGTGMRGADASSGNTADVEAQARDHAMAARAQSKKPDGGGRKYAMVALVIALFAGVITAGYGVLGGGDESASSETPLIEASTDPVKVRPEDPGGRVVANQDNASYEKVEGNELAAVEQENLVSQTEEPAIIDRQNLPGNPAAKGEDRLGANDTQQDESGGANNAVTPRVVQVVTVKPDGTIVRTPVTKPETAAGNNTQIASVDTEATPVPTEPIRLGEPIDGAQTTGQPQVPTASPVPKPEPEPVITVQPAVPAPKPVEQAAAPQPVTPAPQPATPAPVAKSDWVVQVSAQTSPEAAQQSFDTMRNQYAVLQGRSMSVQRAVVNGTTYFRVRVQTASKDDASQLCNDLTAAGGSCFVTR